MAVIVSKGLYIESMARNTALRSIIDLAIKYQNYMYIMIL